MSKVNSYLTIVSILSISTVLSAAPLDKYSVPQSSSAYVSPANPSVKSDVYTEFREKVLGLSSEEKNELKTFYQKKLAEAVNKKDFDAAAYYQKLIEILGS
jgi:hypothetical protein